MAGGSHAEMEQSEAPGQSMVWHIMPTLAACSMESRVLLAAVRNGIEPVWASEIEAFPSK